MRAKTFLIPLLLCIVLFYSISNSCVADCPAKVLSPIEKADGNMTSFSVQDSAKVMSKKKILEAGGLNVGLDDFEFDVQFEVISYTITSVIKSYTYEVLNEGAAFSTEAIKLIKKVPKGGRIYFENIKVKVPSGKIIVLAPLVIKVI